MFSLAAPTSKSSYMQMEGTQIFKPKCLGSQTEKIKQTKEKTHHHMFFSFPVQLLQRYKPPTLSNLTSPLVCQLLVE